MTQTIVLFAIAGALGCLGLGLMVGRLVTLKGFTWTLKDAIGVTLIGAFISVLFILFWKAIPKANEQLIVYMLGQLSGFVAGVVSSHYGTKAGDDKLAKDRNETAKVQAVTAGKLADAVTASASGGTDPNSIKAGDTITVEKPPEDK